MYLINSLNSSGHKNFFGLRCLREKLSTILLLAVHILLALLLLQKNLSCTALLILLALLLQKKLVQQRHSPSDLIYSEWVIYVCMMDLLGRQIGWATFS